jgi:hypothetical protein
MGNKRVKFSNTLNQHEYLPETPQSSSQSGPEEGSNKRMYEHFSDDSEVPMPTKGLGAPRDPSSDSEDNESNLQGECGSSEEDYENGNLFKKLKRDCN